MPSVAGVAEWQTRRIQNPLPLKACGFKSHLRHMQKTLKDQCLQGVFILLKMPFDYNFDHNQVRGTLI